MVDPARYEVPTGVVDGVNTLFTLAASYHVGSPVVLINGLSRVAALADGWVEIPPDQIDLKVAPQVGEVVQVWYRPTG